MYACVHSLSACHQRVNLFGLRSPFTQRVSEIPLSFSSRWRLQFSHKSKSRIFLLFLLAESNSDRWIGKWTLSLWASWPWHHCDLCLDKNKFVKNELIKNVYQLTFLKITIENGLILKHMFPYIKKCTNLFMFLFLQHLGCCSKVNIKLEKDFRHSVDKHSI